MKKLLLVLALSLFPTIASAHPGNTDAYGGHTCRTNCAKWGLSYGEYHYHNPKSGGIKFDDKASERRAQNEVNRLTEEARIRQQKLDTELKESLNKLKTIYGSDYCESPEYKYFECKTQDDYDKKLNECIAWWGGESDVNRSTCTAKQTVCSSSIKAYEAAQISYDSCQKRVVNEKKAIEEQKNIDREREIELKKLEIELKKTEALNKTKTSDPFLDLFFTPELNALIEKAEECIIRQGGEFNYETKTCGPKQSKAKIKCAAYGDRGHYIVEKDVCAYCPEGYKYDNDECIFKIIPKTATVSIKSLIVRQSPSPKGKMVGKVSKNQVYSVLEEQKAWTKIDLGEGKEGWVMKQYIKIK